MNLSPITLVGNATADPEVIHDSGHNRIHKIFNGGRKSIKRGNGGQDYGTGPCP